MDKIIPNQIFFFLNFHTGFGYQSELEARVAEAARRQYNKLKMQTKAEIRQTIDRLLVGEFIVSFSEKYIESRFFALYFSNLSSAGGYRENKVPNYFALFLQ